MQENLVTPLWLPYLHAGLRLSLIFVPERQGVWERAAGASYIICRLPIGYRWGMRTGPAKGSVPPHVPCSLFAIVLDCSNINGPLCYLHQSSCRVLNGESYFTRGFSFSTLCPLYPFITPSLIISPHSSIKISVVCPIRSSRPNNSHARTNREIPVTTEMSR
jgi:hypothetical protein